MTSYSKEEVFQSTLKYFENDVLSTDVWMKKYALKDENGTYQEKTPEDMHHRLAKEFSRIEKKYENPISEDEIFNLLKDFKYIVPQGGSMAGIGNNNQLTSLSNCFVIGNNYDSYGGIMRTDEEQIQLMKRRGGVGHDISHLRPSGSFANNSILSGLAGSTLYMNRYSDSTREVSQDGRRGALMLSISCKHPDAERFIDMKLEQGKITGANISIKITDEFMEAVRHDDYFYQTFPIDKTIEELTDFLTYSVLFTLEENKLYKGNGGYYKKVRAKRLWNKIVYNAWKSAEPGILFWDTVLNNNPTKGYGKEWQPITTNPCGEIPLNSYDSCRLLVINLYSYVENPFTSKSKFNFDLFKKHALIAQRLMDDIVDLEIEKIDKILKKIDSDPEPFDIKRVEINLWKKIKENATNGRRTGLGITGEGDMFAALRLKYDSDEALNQGILVHKLLSKCSYISSINLAKERGSFPIFDLYKEKDNTFIDRIKGEFSKEELECYVKYGRRNISNLTISPTGTTSLMTRTTSGIEPVFLPIYKRKRKVNKIDDNNKNFIIDEVGDKWEEYKVFHPKFIKWFEINYWDTVEDKLGIESSLEWLEGCSDELIDKYYKESPYFGSTSEDIDWVKKVKLQGSIQKWIDHSISVTVNVSNKISVEEVNEVYLSAFREGCKGITIYRQGSREGVLKSLKTEKDDFNYIDAIKRGKILECDIYHKQVFKEDMIILVGLKLGKPFEIFAFKNGIGLPSFLKKGKIIKESKRHYRLESYEDEKLYKIDNIIDYLNETESNETRSISTMLRHRIDPKHIIKQIRSYALITSQQKAIERVLKNYVEEEICDEVCPNCGGVVKNESGCKICLDCGWSACN